MFFMKNKSIRIAVDMLNSGSSELKKKKKKHQYFNISRINALTSILNV